jgi:hypothetical protein
MQMRKEPTGIRDCEVLIPQVFLAAKSIRKPCLWLVQESQCGVQMAAHCQVLAMHTGTRINKGLSNV